ncbi:MAG: OmpA family protein [Cocleimonas sp.]
MILHNKKLLLTSLFVSATVLSSTAYADQNALNEGWYVGGSVGKSSMDPGTGGTNWSTKDKNDYSKKLYVGKELNESVALEGFWTDLGAAGMKSSSGPTGKIAYKGIGANVTYKIPKAFGNLQPFAKLGITKLKTTNSGAVTRDQLNKTSMLAGIGADYKISEDLQLRTEFNRYDKDIHDLNVGVKWSPGARPHKHNRVERPVAKPVVAKPKARPAPRPVVKRRPVPKPKVVYVPKKVYVNRPAPKPQYQIMRRSLAGGSNFATGSAELTLRGENVLNQLVNDINNNRITVRSIDIVGHTDSVGSKQSNQHLSVNRANSVASYLSSRGVKRHMMRTYGRGESEPIANNKTARGKAQNRRVEIAINGTSREIVRTR